MLLGELEPIVSCSCTIPLYQICLKLKRSQSAFVVLSVRYTPLSYIWGCHICKAYTSFLYMRLSYLLDIHFFPIYGVVIYIRHTPLSYIWGCHICKAYTAFLYMGLSSLLDIHLFPIYGLSYLQGIHLFPIYGVVISVRHTPLSYIWGCHIC